MSKTCNNVCTLFVSGDKALAEYAQEHVSAIFGLCLDDEATAGLGVDSPWGHLAIVQFIDQCPSLALLAEVSAVLPKLVLTLASPAGSMSGESRVSFRAGKVLASPVDIACPSPPSETLVASNLPPNETSQSCLLDLAKGLLVEAFSIMDGETVHDDYDYRMRHRANNCFKRHECIKKLLSAEAKAALEERLAQMKLRSKQRGLRLSAAEFLEEALRKCNDPDLQYLFSDEDNAARKQLERLCETLRSDWEGLFSTPLPCDAAV